MASVDKGLEEIPEGEHRENCPEKHTATGCAAKLKESKLMELCLAGQIESNYDETVDSFDTMNLKPELLRGTTSLVNYTKDLG